MSGSATANIRETYGAAFIGLLLSTAFYGVTIAQTWIYYSQYRRRDPMALKGLIAFLFILDTLHTILCTYSLYWYLILNFGNVANLDVNMWAMNIQIIVNGLIRMLVQIFYARRVHILSKNIVIPVIIVILSVLCFVLGSVFTAEIFSLKLYSRYGSLIWVASVGISSSVAADINITLAMCWHLYHNKTGSSKTDSIIKTLMTYCVHTGLVSSLLAIGKLVSFITMPTTFIWMAFFWLMGKSNVNSFLAVLNNRDTLRARRSDDNWNNDFHISSSFRQNVFKSKSGQTAVSFAAVHPTVTTEFVGSTNNSDNEPGLEKSAIIIASVHDRSPELAV